MPRIADRLFRTRPAVAAAALMTGALVAGCSYTEKRPFGSDNYVTGTVTYFERMALKPDADVTVKLIDATASEGPGEVIVSQQSFRSAGKQVPLNFELPYREDRISREHRYELHARIVVGGRLSWFTRAGVPALTQGAPRDDIEVVVTRASANP
jgi:putative lipoprotein